MCWLSIFSWLIFFIAFFIFDYTSQIVKCRLFPSCQSLRNEQFVVLWWQKSCSRVSKLPTVLGRSALLPLSRFSKTAMKLGCDLHPPQPSLRKWACDIKPDSDPQWWSRTTARRQLFSLVSSKLNLYDITVHFASRMLQIWTPPQRLQ